MYEDPKKYSFHLQSYIQETMFEIQVKNSTFPIKITERSLLSERFVFIQYLKSTNLISELEYNILNKWFELLNTLVPKVDEIIYVKTQPEEVYKQLKLRNRIEEKSVELSYLTELHKLHENWLVNKTLGFHNNSLITIVEQNFESNNTSQIYNSIVDRLENKLNYV
jgi:deoxyadenosine/deoxycytidine kinase